MNCLLHVLHYSILLYIIDSVRQRTNDAPLNSISNDINTSNCVNVNCSKISLFTSLIFFCAIVLLMILYWHFIVSCTNNYDTIFVTRRMIGLFAVVKRYFESLSIRLVPSKHSILLILLYAVILVIGVCIRLGTFRVASDERIADVLRMVTYKSGKGLVVGKLLSPYDHLEIDELVYDVSALFVIIIIIIPIECESEYIYYISFTFRYWYNQSLILLLITVCMGKRIF